MITSKNLNVIKNHLIDLARRYPNLSGEINEMLKDINIIDTQLKEDEKNALNHEHFSSK